MVGAAGSRAPRAATARGAATGTGPTCSLSVETPLFFHLSFALFSSLLLHLTRERSTAAGRRRSFYVLRGAGAFHHRPRIRLRRRMNSECLRAKTILYVDDTHSPCRA